MYRYISLSLYIYIYISYANNGTVPSSKVTNHVAEYGDP